MIDFDLSKLALISAVALVVIGPEKLPKVARVAGSMLGRVQRYISDVKAEVSREMEIEELRKMQRDIEDAGQTISQDIATVENQIHASVNQAHEVERRPAFEAEPVLAPAPLIADESGLKARHFRRKKLMRIASVPRWYKNQSNRRAHVISDAARMAKYGEKRAAMPLFPTTRQYLTSSPDML